MNTVAGIIISMVVLAALAATIITIVILFMRNEKIRKTLHLDIESLVNDKNRHVYKRVIARRWKLLHWISVFVAAELLLLFAPLMLAISITIKVTTSESVFVKREILGMGNKFVQLIKFRTTTNNPNSNRSLRFGRILHISAFEYIPHLLNVVKGDLSLIGLRRVDREEVQRAIKAVPDFVEPYKYCRPGLVSLLDFNRKQMKRVYQNEEDLNWITYNANIEYIERRSLKLIASAIVYTIVLSISPDFSI